MQIMSKTTVSYRQRISEQALAVLEQLQKAGYVVPENAENEVAVSLHHAAWQIAMIAENELKPDQYILLDGSLYNKLDIKTLETYNCDTGEKSDDVAEAVS
jgi:hypothetical protein